ncbi:MAG: hypothetical protein GF368_03915 [Candidatus Aenigmarchaeota archaeon]|nr:hypothetical protein [Candidatus Aenigmarchaeota archaeon]
MKKNLIILIMIFPLVILFVPVYSRKVAVGVSPAVLDLGNLERSSSEFTNFYIVSPSGSNLLVYLDKIKGNFDFFNKDNYRGLTHNYSEEDSLSWLKIVENPIEIKKSNENLGFGGSVKGYRDVGLILNVPENAEPGYHIIGVVPSPSTNEIGEDIVGAQVIGVSPVRIIFNIPGEAIRKGKILDVLTDRSGNNIELNTHFFNSGTVTISAKATEIVIKNGEGEIVKELTSNLEYVGPEKIEVLKSYFSSESIDPGEYDVFVKVNYNTGSTTFKSTINIEPELMKKITGEVKEAGFKFPWWILLILIFIIILIYKRMRK